MKKKKFMLVFFQERKKGNFFIQKNAFRRHGKSGR